MSTQARQTGGITGSRAVHLPPAGEGDGEMDFWL